MRRTVPANGGDSASVPGSQYDDPVLAAEYRLIDHVRCNHGPRGHS